MSTSFPQRKRLRYKEFDYLKLGAYFVTICVENRLPLLGIYQQDSIMLTQAGTMVLEVWRTLPDSFVNVTLDSFVVMPNHLHFIIWLGTPLDRSEDNEKSKQSSEADNSVQPSLPEIMQWFKSLTTAKYRHGVNTLDWPAFPGKLWQRSYYDHIVRSDEALYAIRSYIHSNPQRWLCDRYHPQPFGRDDDAIALWQLLKSEEPPR